MTPGQLDLEIQHHADEEILAVTSYDRSQGTATITAPELSIVRRTMTPPRGELQIHQRPDGRIFAVTSYDDAKARLHNLLARFGNQQAKERYGIEETGERGPEGDEEVDEDGMQLDGGTDYAADSADGLANSSFSSQSTESDEDMYDAIARAITPEDWVGPLTAKLEVWHLDNNAVPARRAGPISVLPAAAVTSDPIIKITDIIPPQHQSDFDGFDATRVWTLDMELYRYYLDAEIKNLAHMRALDYLRPRDKDRVDHEEQAYSSSSSDDSMY